LTPQFIGIALAVLAILVAAVALARIFFSKKPTPEEVERLRRLQINEQGKLGDGEILDVDPATWSITYAYSVAGVGYTAAQDATGLQAQLPADPMTMIGPVAIKFVPKNPANSIIVCEDWSGLRQTGRNGGGTIAKA
jgi:hypothetical protein